MRKAFTARLTSQTGQTRQSAKGVGLVLHIVERNRNASRPRAVGSAFPGRAGLLYFPVVYLWPRRPPAYRCPASGILERLAEPLQGATCCLVIDNERSFLKACANTCWENGARMCGSALMSNPHWGSSVDRVQTRFMGGLIHLWDE